MTSTLLDITNKVDPKTLAVLDSVADVARRLAIPLFLVGATARDLVMHHYYGAKTGRATKDLDFAIQIPDWSTFEAIKAELIQIERLFREELANRSLKELIRESCENNRQFEEHEARFNAFIAGYQSL